MLVTLAKPALAMRGTTRISALPPRGSGQPAALTALPGLRRRRVTAIRPAAAVIISVALAGSGTFVMDTLASSAKGGTPAGVPFARNDSSSPGPVATKSNVTLNQPVKPVLGFVTIAVSCVVAAFEPRLTSHCSVVVPV